MRFQRTVQLVLFGCFIFLLWRATYPLPGWVPVDLFVRLDPFVSVSTMIAARTWIGAPAWGFAVLGVSLVVGRFFCGYICPLGSTIDFSDRFICRSAGRTFRNAGPSQLKSHRWKYLVLVALLCAAVLGVSYTFLLSPLALVTRSYVLVVYPVLLQLGGLGLALTDALSVLPGFGWLRYAQIDQVRFGTAFFSMSPFPGNSSSGSNTAQVLVPNDLSRRSPYGFVFPTARAQTECGRKVHSMWIVHSEMPHGRHQRGPHSNRTDGGVHRLPEMQRHLSGGSH